MNNINQIKKLPVYISILHMCVCVRDRMETPLIVQKQFRKYTLDLVSRLTSMASLPGESFKFRPLFDIEHYVR